MERKNIGAKEVLERLDLASFEADPGQDSAARADCNGSRLEHLLTNARDENSYMHHVCGVCKRFPT